VPNNPVTSEVKRDDAEYTYKCVLWTRIDEVIARTALSTSPIECSVHVKCIFLHVLIIFCFVVVVVVFIEFYAVSPFGGPSL
jgi:hypothetical protein